MKGKCHSSFSLIGQHKLAGLPATYSVQQAAKLVPGSCNFCILASTVISIVQGSHASRVSAYFMETVRFVRVQTFFCSCEHISQCKSSQSSKVSMFTRQGLILVQVQQTMHVYHRWQRMLQ